ncbi:PAS domain S-box protein [Saprospiraceae bacterium]|nr:PAS domain S-box protein [Saprospiraceae bacterium]
MKEIADFQGLNTDLLELSLYKSIYHTQDVSKCVAKFVTATCKALDFDDGVLLKKSKDGKWKVNKESPSFNTHGQLDLPKQFVIGVQKESVVFLDNKKLIAGLDSDVIYASQLFVSLSSDSILLLYSKLGGSSIKEFSWVIGPCKAFYQHYSFLHREKRYEGIADKQLNHGINREETELRHSEHLLDSLLQFSPSSYVAYDKDLKITYFNQGAFSTHKEFLGINLKKGMSIDEFADDTSSFWHKKENRSKLFTEGIDIKEVLTFNIGDKEIYMNFEVKPILDDKKNIIGYMESGTDVSEVTRKNKTKREKISTLSAVLNSTNNSIYAIDRNMALIAINQHAQDDFERFCGKRPNVGDNLNDIIEPDVLSKWKERYYDKVLNGEKISFTGEDSSGRVVESVYTAVNDDNDEIIGCLEVCRDISELSKNKQELEIRESQLRILVENVPTGIIRSSIEQEIVDISDSVVRITGYESHEIKGHNLYDIVHRDDRKSLEKYIDELKSGINKSHSTRLRHKNGNILHVEGLGSIITNSNNDKIEYLLTINDVTEKVNIERNLEVTKGNYNRLFKNLHDGVIVFNFDTWEILDYNDAFVNLYGSEDFKDAKMQDILPEKTKFLPDVNLHEEFAHTAEAIKNKKKLKFTTVLFDHNKEEKLVEASVIPSNQEDEIAYVIIKDITKSYLISVDAKQKTAIYEKLISESSEGIDIIEYVLPINFDIKDVDINSFAENDRPHRIVVRNHLMHEYLNGIDSSMTSMEEVIKLLRPIQRDNTTAKEKAEKIFIDTINNRRSAQELTIDNGERCYDFNLTQNIVHINQKLYIIRHLNDISKKIKSEKIIEDQISDLNTTNEEMQKYIDSNLQLENFAYIASHDLKAPIRSVISFMQLLKKNIINKVDEKDIKFVDIVLAASTNMQVLIDDLLDYSRINTQAVVYEKVDINKLLKFLKRDLITTIEDSEATIEIDDMPTIFADESRLRQVFQNLITNGIKFMDKKGTKPVIHIKYEEQVKEHHFTVSDNGIGIEADYLDKIFLMFKKLHSENRYTGTGIGLSICKKVTDQHNGKIWVDSELGKGSTFHFTICKEIKPQ